MRQKLDIHELNGSLENLSRLRGVSYIMMADTDQKRKIGLIAQDVERVFPELVSSNPDGIKSLNYNGLIAPLVEAVKELNEQNKALQLEIEELRLRLQALEGRQTSDRFNN